MTIKWGIIGAGGIAEKFAADFELVTNGEIIAVASRSLQKAEKFAKTMGINNAYGSYADMLTNPDIDIIYVATTHNFHFEHTKLCFEYDKHVLCEKPITVNAVQLKELSSIAKSKNLFFMEAMWSAFLPAIKQALTWVKQGRIGDVKLIQANFGFIANTDINDRLFNPNLAGGALLDIGIYPLTVIEMFAQSEIENILCSSEFTTTGVDATIAIQIDYKNGIKGQMASTFRTNLINDAVIYGTKGYIQIPDFFMSKKAILKIGNRTEVFDDPTKTLGYNFETVAVNNDLLNDRTENQIMPLSRSLKMMELLDLIREKIGLKYPFE